MRERNSKAPFRKIVLRLRDLDQAKSAVFSSLSSPCSRRNYKFAMDHYDNGLQVIIGNDPQDQVVKEELLRQSDSNGCFS